MKALEKAQRLSGRPCSMKMAKKYNNQLEASPCASHGHGLHSFSEGIAGRMYIPAGRAGEGGHFNGNGGDYAISGGRE